MNSPLRMIVSAFTQFMPNTRDNVRQSLISTSPKRNGRSVCSTRESCTEARSVPLTHCCTSSDPQRRAGLSHSRPRSSSRNPKGGLWPAINAA